MQALRQQHRKDSLFHTSVNSNVDIGSDNGDMICGDVNQCGNGAHRSARAEEGFEQTRPRRSSVGAIGNLACLCGDGPGHAGVQRKAGKRREL
jgi:hypothetical protein